MIRSIAKRLLSAAALAAVLSLVPLSVTSMGAVRVNDACAAGACCMELGSFCGTTLNYYDTLDDVCSYPGGPKPGT